MLHPDNADNADNDDNGHNGHHGPKKNQFLFSFDTDVVYHAVR